MKPILYIAATPIGSFRDVSSHLITALKDAQLILCEDTRHTRKLLKAFNIEGSRLESLHQHNERQKSALLKEKILKKNLSSIVLVSDAGTPAISDPGAHIVALAHEYGIEVRNIPGPSSLVCGLASSGFIQPRSLFVGFLPRQANKQLEEFQTWIKTGPCVVVFFESPKRLKNTFSNLSNYFLPTTRICLSREISKKFEQNTVCSLEEASKHFQTKKEVCGEYVISLEITKQSKTSTLENQQEQNQELKQGCKKFAQKYGLSAKSIYNFIVKAKESPSNRNQ